MLMRSRLGLLIAARLGGVLALGCAATGPMPDMVTPSRIGGMTFIGPRCADVRSCLVGQVVAAETATPMPSAAVFLEREEGPAKADGPVCIVIITDD